MSRSAIIIGAGIGGLATANLLAKAGFRVTVYEKNAQPGGRAGKLERDGFRFDTGPSWYLMPEVFEHYYQLLGTRASDQLDLVQLSPAYKVFFENAAPLTVSTDAKRDQAAFEAIEPGAGDKLHNYVQRGVLTYRLAVDHFLYTNFTSLRDFLAPNVLRYGPRMLQMALTPIDRYIARSFRDPRLQHILEYTMVFLGASPYEAPALYSLMSALDFQEGVYYPRGGIYTIIDSLVALGTSLGVTYQYTAPVTHIEGADGTVSGITLQDGTTATADIVVSNADTYFTETRLLAPEHQTYPERYWQKREAGPSALLLYLGVKGALPEIEHHSLLFVDAWRENFEAIYHTRQVPESASIYLARPSATDPTVAPPGHEALVVLVPLPSGISLSDKEQEQLAEAYVAQITRMTGVDDLASRIVSRTIVGPDDFARNFNAWRSTALGPSHTLRQSALFRTGNKSKKLRNLYYVGGSTLPGIGLPMCLIGAELVYKHIAGDTRGGRVKTIEPLGEDG